MTTTAFKELQPVRLTQDIPDRGLASGALGAILIVFKAGEAYLVEFTDGDGDTIAQVTLKADAIEPLKAPAH